MLQVLAPVFSLLLPKYQFSRANKRGIPVSRDPAALIAKYTDTLGPYGFGLVLRYCASQALYDEATSQYKAIKLYEVFLHDLLFEPERDDIVYDIINWMEIKLTTSPPMTRRV